MQHLPLPESFAPQSRVLGPGCLLCCTLWSSSLLPLCQVQMAPFLWLIHQCLLAASPGLTPMFSLLVTVSPLGQWVDSHLATFISRPAQAGTGTGKFKINKVNDGRKLKSWGFKDGISRTNQQKNMIIWGLRCFPQNCISRAAEYTLCAFGTTPSSEQFFLVINITHTCRTLARLNPSVYQ